MNHLSPRDVEPPKIPTEGALYFRKYCPHTRKLGKLCCKCSLKPIQPWHLYWDELGFDPCSATPGDLPQNLRDSGATVPQMLFEWLYFGVLDVYFAYKEDLGRVFIWPPFKEGPGHLTTFALDIALNELHSRLMDGPKKKYKKWVISTEDLSRHVFDFFEQHLQPTSHLLGLLSDDQVMALLLLYDILESSKRMVTGLSSPFTSKLLVQPFIAKRMRNNNRCPSVIRNLGSRISLSYYASIVDEEHLPLHIDCDEKECSRNQIDESRFVTKHTVDCATGDCEIAACNAEELVKIVERGSIPLVKLDFAGNVQVGDYRVEQCKYIAICHAWDDGGGNPYANAIPSCQVQLIRRQLSYLGDEYNESVPCFLDTLCVPVAREERIDHDRRKSVKRTLTVRMNEIYKHAAIVLVRDASLMKISKHAWYRREVVNLCFHVILSQWFTRLWTLQEAVAARRLFICFSDGCQDFQDLFLRLAFEAPIWKIRLMVFAPNLAYDIWEYLDSPNNSICRVAGDSPNFERQVAITLDLFPYRHIGHVKDELLYFSSVLRLTAFELSELDKLSYDARTKWLVKRLGRSSFLLTMRRGSHLSPRGCLWWLQTLIQGLDATPADLHTAISSDGLCDEWKTVFFMLPPGFADLLRLPWVIEQEPNLASNKNGYAFVIVTQDRSCPWIILDFEEEEDHRALRDMEGMPLVLLSPLTIHFGQMFRKSILAEPHVRPNSKHKFFGVRKRKCLARWATAVDKPMPSSSSAFIVTGDLWNGPDAKNFWVIDGAQRISENLCDGRTSYSSDPSVVKDFSS